MKKLLICTMLLTILSGCASIVSSSDYSIIINSEQDGVDFKIKNSSNRTITKGQTPEIVRLKASDGFFSGAEYMIEYLDKQYPIYASVDGWYWGNILLGGLIGMLIVDPATGAMYKLPDEVFLDEPIIAKEPKEKETRRDQFELN